MEFLNRKNKEKFEINYDETIEPSKEDLNRSFKRLVMYYNGQAAVILNINNKFYYFDMLESDMEEIRKMTPEEFYYFEKQYKITYDYENYCMYYVKR